MKPFRRRVLTRINRGQHWLKKAREEYDRDQPRAGARHLDLAIAELQLAREKSEFWGWQQKSPRKKVWPWVAGFCCMFLLAGGMMAIFSGPDLDHNSRIVESFEVERQLVLPREYFSSGRPSRILEDPELQTTAAFHLHREIENLMVPADL